MDEEETSGDVSLGLATLEQIVLELGKRHTCVVLATDGTPGQPADQDYVACFYMGSRVHAVGLADWLREYLLEQSRVPHDDGDVDDDGEGS